MFSSEVSFQNFRVTPESNFVFKGPSVAEAKKVFWKLGDKFWMQIIDGEFHDFGCQVFDKGLHGGPKEPGFFLSLYYGCVFASNSLLDAPNVEFYKNLHKVLCAHFRGPENRTGMLAEMAGRYRNNSTEIRLSLFDIFGDQKEVFLIERLCQKYSFVLNKELREKFGSDVELKALLEGFFDECMLLNSGHTKWLEKQKSKLMSMSNVAEHINNLYEQTAGIAVGLKEELKEKVIKINEEIDQISLDVNEEPFVKLSIFEDGNSVHGSYLFSSRMSLKRITEKLFDGYNEKMRQLNLISCATKEDFDLVQEQKLDEIARLYQWLEWLHPFADGQGRTDLVLLAKLLTEQGFNPSILEYPYFSTMALFSQWRGVLKQGMQRFRDVVA